MGKRLGKVALIVLCALVLGVGAVAIVGGAPPQHPTRPAALGTASRTSALEAVMDQPGTVQMETVVGADWSVPRGGLIDLNHPEAQKAGLEGGDEPIKIIFHVLRHPSRGLYLVDSGVERKLQEAAAESAVGALLVKVSAPMRVHMSTGAWLAEHGPVAGVMLTHMHIDHVMGLPDLPAETVLYAGPEIGSRRSVKNLLTAPVIERELAGKEPLQVWPFQPDPDGVFAGVLDVFGDQMVWALWVPGHTPGSTAFVVRSPRGPVLITGDACHTRWGWEHHVPPGTFSEDPAQSDESFRRLQALVARHPSTAIHLGHQE